MSPARRPRSYKQGTNGQRGDASPKLPSNYRTCKLCFQRKVRCSREKQCEACRRYARSTGADPDKVVCEYACDPAELVDAQPAQSQRRVTDLAHLLAPTPGLQSQCAVRKVELPPVVEDEYYESRAVRARRTIESEDEGGGPSSRRFAKRTGARRAQTMRAVKAAAAVSTSSTRVFALPKQTHDENYMNVAKVEPDACCPSTPYLPPRSLFEAEAETAFHTDEYPIFYLPEGTTTPPFVDNWTPPGTFVATSLLSTPQPAFQTLPTPALECPPALHRHNSLGLYEAPPVPAPAGEWWPTQVQQHYEPYVGSFGAFLFEQQQQQQQQQQQADTKYTYLPPPETTIVHDKMAPSFFVGPHDLPSPCDHPSSYPVYPSMGIVERPLDVVNPALIFSASHVPEQYDKVHSRPQERPAPSAYPSPPVTLPDYEYFQAW